MPETISHPIHHDETGRRRVLLKLSGEVFGGGEVGISTEVVRSIAKQIAATVGQVETSIVIGGGNFFRGAELSQAGKDRSRADCSSSRVEASAAIAASSTFWPKAMKGSDFATKSVSELTSIM